MNKRIFLSAFLILVLAAPSFAARVDTLLVNSPSMNKDVQVIVVTPDVALGKKAVACPVIYLLHGYGGEAKKRIGGEPNLPQIAGEKRIIFFFSGCRPPKPPPFVSRGGVGRGVAGGEIPPRG